MLAGAPAAHRPAGRACAPVLPTAIAQADAALERFDLSDKLFERVDRLSGGERQRVGLARAGGAGGSPQRRAAQLAGLVDEPLSALGPDARPAQATPRSSTQAARERGATLVATLHQVDMALAHFPRIIGLREGSSLSTCPPRRSAGALARLYAQHLDELTGPAPEMVEVARRGFAAGGHALPLSAPAAFHERVELPPASPDRRDPAWLGRMAWAAAALVLLWPLLVPTEFKPWVFWSPAASSRPCAFSAHFLPPALEPGFLWRWWRARSWRTVAMATAGMTLALVLAVPLALLSMRVLSVSALSGRMAADAGRAAPGTALPC